MAAPQYVCDARALGRVEVVVIPLTGTGAVIGALVPTPAPVPAPTLEAP